MGNILPGIDSFINQAAAFKKIRAGLVTNNAAATSTGKKSRIALLESGFHIVKLFSPEHGLSAKGEDGAYQHNTVDSQTQLPVVSLYGDHLIPTAKDVNDIDVLIFDIPDVGCRFYTYLWTMTYVMEACAAYNKPLIILDRSNPISGDIRKTEGPMLNEKDCSSFIGRWSIPIRHSCTPGELAVYFSTTRKMDIDLTIIRVTNWNRNELPFKNKAWFIPTSPAISTVETALCYPGTGLLESITVNEGRGTANPFNCFGAPWIDTAILLEALQKKQLPGINFTTVQYTPTDSLYAHEQCYGLALSITDENIFLPVHTGVTIIQQLLALFPEHAKERLYKTVANPSGTKHAGKLLGVANSLQLLKEGKDISTELNGEWEEKITPYLLYH